MTTPPTHFLYAVAALAALLIICMTVLLALNHDVTSTLLPLLTLLIGGIMGALTQPKGPVGGS